MAYARPQTAEKRVSGQTSQVQHDQSPAKSSSVRKMLKNTFYGTLDDSDQIVDPQGGNYDSADIDHDMDAYFELPLLPWESNRDDELGDKPFLFGAASANQDFVSDAFAWEFATKPVSRTGKSNSMDWKPSGLPRPPTMISHSGDSAYYSLPLTLSDGEGPNADQSSARSRQKVDFFPEPCSICGRQLKSRSAKAKHRHTHDKPFHCEVSGCTRIDGFASPSDLERHRKTVHGMVPRVGKTSVYRCKACSPPNQGADAKKWTRLDNFKAHIRRKHKDIDLDKLVKESELEHSSRNESLDIPVEAHNQLNSTMYGQDALAGVSDGWEEYDARSNNASIKPSRIGGTESFERSTKSNADKQPTQLNDRSWFHELEPASSMLSWEEPARSLKHTPTKTSDDAQHVSWYSKEPRSTQRHEDLEKSTSSSMGSNAIGLQLSLSSSTTPVLVVDTTKSAIPLSKGGVQKTSLNSPVEKNVAQSDEKLRPDTGHQAKSSTLVPQDRNQLSIDFAQSLADSLQLGADQIAAAIDHICSFLPNLLVDFSDVVEHSAPLGLGKEPCAFIRQCGTQIAQDLGSILSAESIKSTNASSVDAALQKTPTKYPRLQSKDRHSIYEYLTQCSEFKWLLGSIQSKMLTTSTLNTDTTIRQDLKNIILSERNIALILELDWHPQSFLEDQYDPSEGVELQNVLCCSGLDADAYVAPCIEYVGLLWPNLGKETIACLSKGLRNRWVDFSGRFSDGTTVAFDLGVRVTVHVTGTSSSLVEVAEILAWAGAACGASPSPERISYCRPRIEPPKYAGATGCRVLFECSDTLLPMDVSQKQSSTCWHQMFRNPTIAYGYPIPRRHHNERGLEISLDTMSCLGAARWIIDFNQTLFLKGFFSLFVPMMQVGQSIIWHYLLNTDGTRMPYSKGLGSGPVTSNLSRSSLEQSRHFVGWTPSAKIIAGTEEANYNVRFSDSQFSKPGIGTLSNVTISAGHIIKVGANFSLGKKDTSITVADSRPYEQQMSAASDMHVAFYDTDAQKGWLLDGATALLHLSRAWFSSPYALFSAEDASKNLTSGSSFDGRESSLRTLNAEDNRKIKLYSRRSRTSETGPSESYWCWENLVEQKWIVLEQIYEHIERLQAPASVQLSSSCASKILEGFEFCDILSSQAKIKPKTFALDTSTATWLDIIKDNSIVPIFGSGFGELIVSQSASTRSKEDCSQRASVPDGYNYLTAPLSVIKKIAEHYDEREDGSVALSESAYWAKPDACIVKCKCTGKGNRRCLPSVAKLQSDIACVTHLENLVESMGKKPRRRPKTSIFKHHPNGAIIFGHGTKTAAKRACKRKQNFDDDTALRNVRSRGSDSGVDLGSSDSSQNVSSPSNSQPSV